MSQAANNPAANQVGDQKQSEPPTGDTPRRPEEEMLADEHIITLEGEDGRSYDCRIIAVFEFEGKEYALLLNESAGEEGGEPEEARTVIMQLIQKDDQAIFRTIESDEEFERVIAFVNELASEMSDEEQPQA